MKIDPIIYHRQEKLQNDQRYKGKKGSQTSSRWKHL